MGEGEIQKDNPALHVAEESTIDLVSDVVIEDIPRPISQAANPQSASAPLPSTSPKKLPIGLICFIFAPLLWLQLVFMVFPTPLKGYYNGISITILLLVAAWHTLGCLLFKRTQKFLLKTVLLIAFTLPSFVGIAFVAIVALVNWNIPPYSGAGGTIYQDWVEEHRQH